MVENIPLLSHHHDGLTIEGFSRAAVQTCWRVNELKLLFDVGAQPWDFMGTPTLFITHSHLDHIASLPSYVSRRRMMKMDPPVIYLPDSAVDDAWDMLQMFRRLDRGAMPCELIGLNPGDEIPCGREYLVTAVPTRHTIASLGFVVWQRRHKLKSEYVGLSGDEIRDLKLAGTEITTEKRVPVFAYTGDTSPPGLDNNPEFFDAKILVSELTFVAPEHRKEKIHKHGHMHIDDYRDRQDRFKNELIIGGHLSTRYHDKQVKTLARRGLPGMLDNRLKLWI
ncbi:metal-dependent hydrolase [Roseiconus nitratireducens]|uniref:Metal-dependent hydrolase n=1 Tax=Roseiconus nitratireducens TaxID=2605748 RepID=A0A5M6DIA5_9BACT|nr:MBL fold metallo-hydrolase [Roseiconus nitratireducens]KAA5547317.1 metal-dependent hydrolase [Roseiconus nitratireducens]